MKTALEWLEDTLYPYLNKEDKEYTDVLFNKAKQMEKEQIIKSNRDGVDMVVNKQKFVTGEEYYNETFNK